MFEFNDYDDLHAKCKKFINTNCIVRNTVMPGKLPGTTYTWMFYLRNGLFNVDFLQAISTLFLMKVQNEIGHFDFQITGLETGSTPLLIGIPIFAKMYDLDIPAFSVRKEPKTYGLLNQFEGVAHLDLPCLIVDDLCNSGNSMAKAYQILKDHELPVMNYAFSIVNKVNKGVHQPSRQTTDLYLPKEIKMLYLFDLDDFELSNPSH